MVSPGKGKGCGHTPLPVRNLTGGRAKARPTDELAELRSYHRAFKNIRDDLHVKAGQPRLTKFLEIRWRGSQKRQGILIDAGVPKIKISSGHGKFLAA
jgi:hypothetical protein